MQVPPRTPINKAAFAQRTHHPANSELKRRAAHSSRNALAMQAEHDYSETSISLEAAVSPLEVDALITATALDRDAASLTSKDWAVGLFCPPMQSLIPGNKSPKCSKGFPQSPGNKSQKVDEQYEANDVQDHGTSATQETYESHLVSLVTPTTQSALNA